MLIGHAWNTSPRLVWLIPRSGPELSVSLLVEPPNNHAYSELTSVSFVHLDIYHVNLKQNYFELQHCQVDNCSLNTTDVLVHVGPEPISDR